MLRKWRNYLKTQILNRNVGRKNFRLMTGKGLQKSVTFYDFERSVNVIQGGLQYPSQIVKDMEVYCRDVFLTSCFNYEIAKRITKPPRP